MTFKVRGYRLAAVLAIASSLIEPGSILAQPPTDEGAEFELDAAPETAPAETAPTATPADASPAAPPPEASAEGATAADASRLAALEAELASLRARTESLEAEAIEGEGEAEPAPDARGGLIGGLVVETSRPRIAASSRSRTFAAPQAVRLSGYVQVQYEHSDLSEDQLLPGGTPINQDRFSVRRGRLRLRGAWEYATAELEIDASTVSGPAVSVRRAHLSALYRNPNDADAPPYVAVTAGLTEMPFGLELQLGQEELIFMERSTGSLAFFPGPTDVGVVTSGGYGPVRYDLAVMNGSPIDDRAGTLRREPNRAPDFMGRVGVDVATSEDFTLVGGVSFLVGKGFHPGTDATKPTLQWNDLDNDNVFDAGEVEVLVGRPATPSENFDRWALGADLAFGVHSMAGWTRFYGEVTMATNLDRGLYVADPVTAGADLRELSAYVGAVQEVTQWAFVGARYDFYDPNSDLLENQRGLLVPADATIHTLSPVVGARWPGHGRLTVQYDAIFDHYGRSTGGFPADLRNNRVTVRVQGEF